jgi:hypothetical protein
VNAEKKNPNELTLNSSYLHRAAATAAKTLWSVQLLILPSLLHERTNDQQADMLP